MAESAYPAVSPPNALAVFTTQPALAVSFGDTIRGTMIFAGSGRDDTQTGAPSLRIRGYASIQFRLAVDEGTRRLTVNARQPLPGEPRPFFVVHANPEIGITRQVATAPAGADWVTIGPAEFTATGNGGVILELVNPAGHRDAWFDDIRLT